MYMRFSEDDYGSRNKKIWVLTKESYKKLVHYSLDGDPLPKLFLIDLFTTENYNYFYANHIP